MKNLFIAIILIALPHFIYAQTARVQVIHNSADTAADTVDVYLNGILLLDDVAFRTASPFIDAPAGVPLQVDIAPGNSTSVGNSIATFTYTLAANETYVLIAEGIVSGSGYNPSTGAAAFDIAVYNMGQESAAVATNTDVLVHHGATDAPAVDVVEVGAGAGAIVQNASYKDFAGYLPLITADYRIEVRPAGATTAVGSYEVPLATLGLQGAAVVAIASGFLDPSQNSNGPAFGIWVALPTGGNLVQLPASTARAQIIHNSADAAADTVDVYLNGDLLLDDVIFRTASPFIDAPAGIPIQVDIAPGNSTSVANSIANFTYTLTANETYVLVAEGIVSGSGYNPSTGAAAFDIAVYDMGQESAIGMNNTDVLIHHGATDAPAVDVVEVGVGAGIIVQNASYKDFAGYLPLATLDYRIEVRATGATTAVGSYEVPLATLGLQGAAVVAIASGFLDPSQNSNGPAFGIWVALPTGGSLVQLPESAARAQIIHNSADAAADPVDIYLNGDLLLDNVPFRTATAFIDVPAGVSIQVDVAPGNSTSVANSVGTFNYTLDADKTYILVAEGIVSASGYNPSTGAAAFDIAVYDMGREVANNATEIDVLVHHGATDAPTVDVRAADTTTVLVDDASYGDFAGYLALMDQDYVIRVTDATGTTVVKSYEAPLNTLNLAGSAITVIASGFLDPSQNSNGPAFGLWVATAVGGALIPLPEVITNVNKIQTTIEGVDMTIAPNPVVSDVLQVSIRSTINETLVVDVVDLQGRTVISLPNTVINQGSNIATFGLGDVTNGTYFVRFTIDNQIQTLPFTVAK